MAPTRAQLAKIHIAKKDLNISDDAYRDILSMNFDVTSSKFLSPARADKLLAFFRAKGWRPKRSRKKDKDFNVTYSDRQHRKVQALWITLGKAGIIRNRGDKAMNSFVKRLTGKDNLRWCRNEDCQILVQALEAMKEQG